MLFNITIEDYSSFKLVLVQWYDFCYKNNKLIQVVKCAEKQNEYFVNMYMF